MTKRSKFGLSTSVLLNDWLCVCGGREGGRDFQMELAGQHATHTLHIMKGVYILQGDFESGSEIH